MAGERLYQLITSRGGNANEYADMVYGIVVSAKPLRVQISNQITIDEQFIVMGKNIGKKKYKAKLKVKTHNDQIGDKSGIRPEIVEDVEIEIDNSLKDGDKVTLIRADGGQQFYLIEREGKPDE